MLNGETTDCLALSQYSDPYAVMDDAIRIIRKELMPRIMGPARVSWSSTASWGSLAARATSDKNSNPRPSSMSAHGTKQTYEAGPMWSA